jgi:hypothetical protein
MKRKRKARWVIIVGIVVIAAGLCASVGWLAYLRFWKGYVWADWTGFGDYTDPKGEYHRAKTLWDWLKLMIVPVVLASAALMFNWLHNKTDRDIARDQQQEEALGTYLKHMSELLTEKDLRESKKDGEVRYVARAWTMAVLRRLNGERKGILLRFLHESELIVSREVNTSSIVKLSGADLRGADLGESYLEAAYLHRVNLHRANLVDANLARADMFGANLNGADLRRACLVAANLHRADLCGADLRRAKLEKADLREAVLARADLRGADLRGSDLFGADLSGARISDRTTLVQTIYDRDTRWPSRFSPPPQAVMMIHVEVDQSGKIADMDVPTVLAYSNGSRYSVLISAPVKHQCLEILSERGRSGTTLYVQFFATGLYWLLRERIEVMASVTIDEEYPGHHDKVKSHLLNLFRRENIAVPKRRIKFENLGKECRARGEARSVLSGAKPADKEITVEEILAGF